MKTHNKANSADATSRVADLRCFKEVLLEMNESKQKIALFIDADNAPANKFEDVLSEVVKYGIVTIRKAYGNWKNPLAMIAASAHDNLCHILPCYH
jgi:hypothetical protein